MSMNSTFSDDHFPFCAIFPLEPFCWHLLYVFSHNQINPSCWFAPLEKRARAAASICQLSLISISIAKTSVVFGTLFQFRKISELSCKMNNFISWFVEFQQLWKNHSCKSTKICQNQHLDSFPCDNYQN